MVDDALLHTRPDGGLGALAIGGISQRLFVQRLFRDGERIFRRGVIALSRPVCLPSFLSGEYANGIFEGIGRACRGIHGRGVYGMRDRLCRTLGGACRS